MKTITKICKVMFVMAFAAFLGLVLVGPKMLPVTTITSLVLFDCLVLLVSGALTAVFGHNYFYDHNSK